MCFYNDIATNLITHAEKQVQIPSKVHQLLFQSMFMYEFIGTGGINKSNLYPII